VFAGVSGGALKLSTFDGGAAISLQLLAPNAAATSALHVAAAIAHGTDSGFHQTYLFYQTENVENTLLDLRGGDDTVRADPGFKFPGDDSSWGIAEGSEQQRG